jgi:hypothetical protein
MIPYSNPAGNNQTTPGAGGLPTAQPVQSLPGATPITATTNPSNSSTPNVIPSGSAVPAVTSTDSLNEFGNIFGSGVGTAANSFLTDISGTDSAVLQEYITSLGPQMATAQAQTNAALGAGGVSANSSVAAIADSNLQAQETASIAGESAQLTESGMQMEESMIQSMFQPAEQYQQAEAMAPWEIAGAALGAVGNVTSAMIPKTVNVV